MIKANRKRLINSILLLFGLLLFLNISGAAQASIEVQMTVANAFQTAGNQNHWQISVGFDKSISLPKKEADFDNPELNPAKNPKNYSLIDVKNGQKIDITFIEIEKDEFYEQGELDANAGLPGELIVFIDPSARLYPDRKYHLYVFDVIFEGKPAKEPPQKAVAFPTNNADLSKAEDQGAVKTEKEDDAKDSLSFTAADGREDANIYLSGQIVAAKKSKPAFTGDIKVEIPYKKIIGNRIHNFNPFFELKVGEGPEVDPDMMKLGLNWEFRLWRYRGDDLQVPIRRILLKNAPQIEADKEWDNVNFTIDSRFRFMSRTYSGKNTTFYFRPFIGQEFGKNIRSLVDEAEGKMIYRPLIGTTMNLIFPINKAGIYNISFEGDYTRRWLLKREVYFEETDDNGFQPLRIGKGPRDYLSTKFNLNFTKEFGTTISYEYGRVPPSFNMVNHKVSFGLTYKIKLE
jgi:hypothetical protein